MAIHRRAFLAAGGLLVASCAHGAETPMDLSQVLAIHTNARGGAAALDAIRTLQNEAEIVEPTFTVRGRYIAQADGYVRVDAFANDSCVFSEGIDSGGGWSWQPGRDPQPASTDGEAALRHGVEFNLFDLHRLSERGHALSLDGRQEIEGTSYYVIKIRLNDGFETYRYIDPHSWMVTRARDVRAVHPDVDATERVIESEYSDFRDVSGVVSSFAWLQRDLARDEVVQRGRLLALEYNVALGVDDFSRARRA